MKSFNNMCNLVNLKAPGNWINDPNGFIYYKGKYHLFYQYFPYADFWGTMHWGHAVSDDLVKWDHLGVALHPSKKYDRNGIFSGSAIEVDGKMNLYYTAVVYDEEREENIHLAVGPNGFQSQAMISSLDGFSFDNFNGKKQIIPVIEDTEVADPHDCRDPKVWKTGDTYYMCLASTHEKAKGVLLLYKSTDAENWEYLNRLESEKLGIILECPDMFEIDGKWYLACSPIDNMKGQDCYANQSVIYPINFDPASGEVEITGEVQFVDYGFDIYAPQSTVDENGLRTMISWARMERAMKPETNLAANGKTWNGLMTIPRVIEPREDGIYTVPHPNIRKYFESEACLHINDGKTVMHCGSDNIQLVTTLKEGQSYNIKGYMISLIDGCLVGDRSALVPEGINVHKRSKTPYIGEECKLEIYINPDFIEIFVNDGKYALSHVTYRNCV